MERAHAEFTAALARQASELQDGIDSAAPDVGKALDLFGRAATVSLWAAASGEDVRPLDRMVDFGFLLMRQAGRNPSFLFPASVKLLEMMSFAAWSHLERFPYRLDVHDLNEAHRLASDVLKLGASQTVPDDVRLRADSVIGQAALRRFQLFGDATLLDQAIAHLQSSVDLQPDANATSALATSLRTRAATSQPQAALTDLNRAGGLLASLTDLNAPLSQLKIYPLFRAEWLAELGLVHLTAARLFGSAAELEKASELTSTAVATWPSSAAKLALAEVQSQVQPYASLIRTTKTAWFALQAALRLTYLALSTKAPKRIIQAFEFAYKLLDQAIDRQVSDETRILWLPRLAQVVRILAPAAASSDKINLAVEAVERLRTRILHEHFPDEDRDLSELAAAGHQALSGAIRASLITIRSQDNSPVGRSLARDELARLTEQVRQLPGFSSFRTRAVLKDLITGIQAPLIYLVPSEPQGVALVLLPDGKSVAIPLPGCPEAAPDAVARFRDAAFSSEHPAGARRIAIETISSWAWENIYEPLKHVLAGHSLAHIIGASYLALVPVHAARTQTAHGFHYLCEDLDIRYAPSCRTLAQARQRQIPENMPKFLAIPQRAGTGSDLEGARKEINEIAACFKAAAILSAEEITSHSIRNAIGGVGWLHAACHGSADPEDSLGSGLILGEGDRFTLRDLFQTNQGHLLMAVLSACQTNVPDPRLPDEGTSLATGLLMGGCRAVIASAWHVPDAATSALMRLFYREISNRNDAPAALRQAQLHFARADASFFDDWRDEWSEPYFWAGFSYLGP